MKAKRNNIMELKNLIIDTKTVWMEYPGLKDFSIEIACLSRKELVKLQKRCTITKFDRGSRIPLEQLDDDKFVIELANALVKDWKGLTLDHLQSLLLIDTSDYDLSEELEYSKDNAEYLLRESAEFNSWLNEVAFDLDNFRDESKGKDTKKAGKTV